MPLKFWGHSVQIAIYLINRLPSHILSHKSPYEKLLHKPLCYSHLKVSGCLCFASTLSNHRTKFDPRAKPCVFLVYPSSVKGYKLLDLTTHQVLISRDAIFHENVFPFHNTSPTDFSPSTSSTNVPNASDISFTPLDSSLSFPIDYPVNIVEPYSVSTPVLNPNPTDSPSISPDIPHLDIPPCSESISSPLRKSTRVSKPPTYLQDYHCKLAQSAPSTSSSSTASTGTLYPLSSSLSYDHLSSSHRNFALFVTAIS